MNHLISNEQEIDLGLSVKWASCNLGATSPEEAGDYYAWGEVITKQQYDWETYRWCKGDYDKQIKYNTKPDFGFVDYKVSLENTDDAAFMHYGEKWRMPTLQEWYELFEKCIWREAILNNVIGYVVTSRNNGNKIFLPYSGFRYKRALGDVGKFGFYWSSSLDPSSPENAWSADLGNGSHIMFAIMRYRGYSIRPVIDYY